MTSEAPTIADYGTWPSTISAARVAAGATPLSSLMLGGADGGDIFWLAGRAAEAGRNTLLRHHGASTDELTPAPFNVRSRVHEYGGGAYLVAAGTVYFSNFADNCIYTIAAAATS
ncbi:MAG: S9 family peptidase, partial [Duganella sp.]